MNIVVVQGVLTREPQERILPDGTLVLEWSVVTGVAETRTWVPVQWIDPPAAVRSCREGAEVLVAGAVRTRWFRAGGANVSRVEVLAASYANPKRAAAASRLRQRAEAELLG
jgi:single-stranded DNA-binding protein